jgi:preprotein translocase subunit YajC
VKRIFSLILIGLAVILSATGCVAGQTTSATGDGTSSGFTSYIPMIVILVLLFGMFYFFMIRPMRTREKKQQQMIQQLNSGDRVITAGGIYGDIVSISDDSIVIKIESGATMRVMKGSILNVRNP